MAEVLPELPPHCKIKSIVACRWGFQASVEVKIDVAMYPHFKYVIVRAMGATISEAIAATQNQNIQVLYRGRDINA